MIDSNELYRGVIDIFCGSTDVTYICHLATGELQYRCQNCGKDLVVDPMDAGFSIREMVPNYPNKKDIDLYLSTHNTKEN